MKVLVVLEAIAGGSGRHVTELAGGLVNAGCDVHVIFSTLRTDVSYAEKLVELKGVTAYVLPMRTKPHWSDIDHLIKIRKYIHKHGPFDVVHAHSSKAGVLGRLAALGTGAIKIYTPHAMRIMDPKLDPISRMIYGGIEIGLAHIASDAIIAVSKFEHAFILSKGVPARKIHTVINGIPCIPDYNKAAVRTSLGLPTDEVCVGFIGRFVPQKAPDRFVRAFAEAFQTAPDIVGVMVGAGPLKNEVHCLARELGVYDRIIWVTTRPGPEVLPAFDMLLMPSLYEAMPYVLLEALSVGVPVISTEVGGIECIDNNITGFVVGQNDLVTLSDKIYLLATNDRLRTEMSANALHKSKEMSVTRMVNETIQVYEGCTPRVQVETEGA